MIGVYTKDQIDAMITILNAREPWMTCARHLTYTDHHTECNLILNDTTLILLNEPVYHDGEEFDAERLIRSNETRDVENMREMHTDTTHVSCKQKYCKLGDNAYFDPIILKRAVRVLKYRDENVTLHYAVDQRTQQKYCRCLTFRTKYGYAMVMACRVKDESNLNEVGTSAQIKRGELLQ